MFEVFLQKKNDEYDEGSDGIFCDNKEILCKHDSLLLLTNRLFILKHSYLCSRIMFFDNKYQNFNRNQVLD